MPLRGREAGGRGSEGGYWFEKGLGAEAEQARHRYRCHGTKLALSKGGREGGGGGVLLLPLNLRPAATSCGHVNGCGSETKQSFASFATALKYVGSA